MVELAEAVEAGIVHMVSSIAAAGLYHGTWREDMFEEAENLDVHPYFRTKHDSEGVVRAECDAALARLPAGDRGRQLGDRRDGQGRRPLLLLQADPADPQRGPAVDADARRRGAGDQPRAGRLRRPGDGPHRPHRGPRRPRLPPHRPAAADRRRGDRHLRPRRQRAAVLGPPPGRRCSRRPTRSCALGLSAVPLAGALVDRALADFGIPRAVLTYVNYPTHFDSRRNPGGARRHRHQGAAAGGLRRQALGLLGAPPRPRPVRRPHPGRRGARPPRADQRRRPGARAADPRRVPARSAGACWARPRWRRRCAARS